MGPLTLAFSLCWSAENAGVGRALALGGSQNGSLDAGDSIALFYHNYLVKP